MANLKAYAGTGKLKDKKVFLAYGGSKLGQSISVLMAKEGADVTIVHLPEQKENAEETKRMIEMEGRSCILFGARLINRHICRKAIEEHVRRFKKLNLLVNNVSCRQISMDSTQPNYDGISEVFQFNMIQMMALTNYALPHMSRGDSIVNATSVEAFKNSGGPMDYVATKGAIVGLTMSLAAQLVAKGIRVNAVIPGPIYTAIHMDGQVAESVEKAILKAPHLHEVQTSEVATNFVFLVSDDDSLYNGRILHSYSMIARNRNVTYHGAH